MTSVIHEQVIEAPVEPAWSVLKDFGDFLRWGNIPGELEGKGVGMIRHMNTPEMGKWAEKLDLADDATMTYGYTLVYGTPIGMASYVARVQAQALGASQTKLTWRGEFEAAEGHDAATIAATLKAAYENMSRGVETEAANP